MGSYSSIVFYADTPVLGERAVDNKALEKRIQEEVEFARALTAVLLAVRLEVAEAKAQEAYDRLAHRFPGLQQN